jgi:hypothetical protein
MKLKIGLKAAMTLMGGVALTTAQSNPPGYNDPIYQRVTI